jgi:hypothetical protein
MQISASIGVVTVATPSVNKAQDQNMLQTYTAGDSQLHLRDGGQRTHLQRQINYIT